MNQPPTFDLQGNGAPGDSTVSVLQAAGQVTIVDFLQNLSPGPANDVPAGQVIQSLTIVAQNPSAFISQPTLVLLAGNPAFQDLQFTLNPNFAGTVQVTVTAVDNGGTAFGGQNSTSKTFNISVIDTSPPAAPSTPDLDPGSDLGTSSTDNITADNTPTFIGTAEAGSTVKIFANTIQVGSGVTDGTGHYSVTTSVLSDGSYSITATATDAANNVSPLSGALSPVVIVTVAPTAPSAPDLITADDTGASNTDNITSKTTPTFTGTASANTLVLLFDGGTQVGSATSSGTGTWSITFQCPGCRSAQHYRADFRYGRQPRYFAGVVGHD